MSTDSSCPSRPTGESTHNCQARQQSARQKKFAVVVAVQPLSRVRLFSTQWTAAHQASLSFTLSQSLLKLMSIGSVMPSNYLILLSPSLNTLRVFSNESALGIRWSKYWSVSISSSNEYSGMVSFRIDWFDLRTVQETLESSPVPQFESISQLSHAYLTTGKTIVLTIETFFS